MTSKPGSLCPSRSRTPQPFTIRPYHANDWPGLRAVHDPARRAELRLAGLEDAFRTLDDSYVAEHLFANRLAVAERRGRVLGFAAWQPDELRWLYVHPDARRQGVGRSLITEGLKQAGNTVNVEVLAGNAPARALYRAMGFRLVGRHHGALPDHEGFTASADLMKWTRPLPQ